jgi:S-adenosylmethionine hydrolase
MKFRFVTFLTDFGLQDEFVGTCHGVIKSIAPDAEIIDITHGIDPQRVLQGALVLANTVQYMPVGVHLAVVDPGVGSRRRPLVLETGNGRLFVGPDNGLLIAAAEKQDGIVRAVTIENRAYALDSVSRTFHGRDVFAPAAAHLALGVELAELGPAVDPAELMRIALPEPRLEPGGRIHAVVVDTDRFGNIQLNLNREQVADAGIEPGNPVEVALGDEWYYAVAARTFADARPGDIILYEDAYRNFALAISGGDAAAMFGATPGAAITIIPRTA